MQLHSWKSVFRVNNQRTIGTGRYDVHRSAEDLATARRKEKKITGPLYKDTGHIGIVCGGMRGMYPTLIIFPLRDTVVKYSGTMPSFSPLLSG
jgi:hypothetical protein